MRPKLLVLVAALAAVFSLAGPSSAAAAVTCSLSWP